MSDPGVTQGEGGSPASQERQARRALAVPDYRLAHKVLRALLWFNVAVSGLGFATFAQLRSVAMGLQTGGVERLQLDGLNMELRGILPMQQLALLLLVGGYCLWMNRVHRVVSSQHALRFSPHAYAFLFVPVVNLVLPYLALSELYRRALGADAQLSLLRVFWASVVVTSTALLLGLVAFRIGGSLPALAGAGEVNMVAEVLLVATCLQLVVLARRLWNALST